MTRRPILEITGFITIAAALHVSAAALLLPDRARQGEAALAPPATLAAGGAAVQALVEAWDRRPDLPDTPQASQPQPDPAQPAAMAAPLPETATRHDVPVALARPDPPPALPNLPAPPDAPRIDSADLGLPTPFEPPSVLALSGSSRPAPRPDRRPQPPREAQQQSLPQAAAPHIAGQAGQATTSAGGGAGGLSAQQQASLMAQWGGQIRSCINRRATPPRGLRQGGRVVLALTIGRDGTIQGAGIAASSGQAALDQAALGAAQRAGQCPAAPAGLGAPHYSFQLPITLNLR